jgi:hypothetical protein
MGFLFYPREQTFPASVGMSQTCQEETPARRIDGLGLTL